ncbi:MAG: hypothetical protein QM652_10680 [Legionella sp.]|uniref:hypothetical protein n=1 Tax=Legionella sp. TaxID=459 RepID=UPI0039E50D77
MANEKREQSALVVPEKLINEVIHIIGDDSPEGIAKLTNIELEARKNYKGPWGFGLFLSYTTRTRVFKDNNAYSKEMREDYGTRLKRFLEIISEGKWESTSYNFYLLVALLKTCKKYKSLQGEPLSLFVEQLKEELFEKIPIAIKEYESSQKNQLQRKNEFESLCKNSAQLRKQLTTCNEEQKLKLKEVPTVKAIDSKLLKKMNFLLTSQVQTHDKPVPLKLASERINTMSFLLVHLFNSKSPKERPNILANTTNPDKEQQFEEEEKETFLSNMKLGQ